MISVEILEMTDIMTKLGKMSSREAVSSLNTKALKLEWELFDVHIKMISTGKHGSGWWEGHTAHWKALEMWYCHLFALSGWLAYFSSGKDLLTTVCENPPNKGIAPYSSSSCCLLELEFLSYICLNLKSLAVWPPGFNWISIFRALDVGFQMEVETTSLIKSHRKSAAVCTFTSLITQLLVSCS